jgi:hypothetical protein
MSTSETTRTKPRTATRAVLVLRSCRNRSLHSSHLQVGTLVDASVLWEISSQPIALRLRQALLPPADTFDLGFR